MAIAQRGSTTHATNASTNSLSCNRPSGVVSGDVLVALVTSNDGAITSSGWTRITHTDGGNPSSFDSTLLYKVAGGSEPSTYSFATGDASNPPMAITITAWSGVDTSSSPIGGSLGVGSSSSTEPKSIAGCTSSPLALPLYSRACRVQRGTNTSDITTFSASGVTELDDVGIWSTGQVSYGQALYMGTEATGNPPSLNITATNNTNESDNVVMSITLLTFNPDVNAPANLATTATVAAYDAVVATGVAALPAVASTATLVAYDVKPGVNAAIQSTATALDASIKGQVPAECANATAAAGGIGAHYGAPPGRTVRVGREGRSYTPSRESRVYTVETGGID